MNALLTLLAAIALAQGPDLEKAQEQAGQAASQAGKAVGRRQDLERLKKDLRYVADELDRELLGPRATAHVAALSLKARVGALRAHGNLDPRLTPVLDALDAFYSTLENRPNVDHYLTGLLSAVTAELRDAAAHARDDAALVARVQAALAEPVDAEAMFPVDLTLADFKKLGPIKIFLVKHRVKHPASHVPTTPADLVKGKRHVQIGVEVEGKVTETWYDPLDGDRTFNIGDLHLEITPEWRLVYHRGMTLPKVGDRVRLKGWTYYDNFHKAEEEYDDADSELGARRKTLWEVHPVMDLEILPPANAQR